MNIANPRPGRTYVNINGALDLETSDTPLGAQITVDGVSAAQLLAKIEVRNRDKRIIHMIWDNATYHKGSDVWVFFSSKNCYIHLIQLPHYCPYLRTKYSGFGVAGVKLVK